ncbi:MAG TPA: hypothetical protein VK504_10995 [Vicinamibacterales bacterium]|nr:hypothetical protein [Vicinamibacterales bacterium]
MKLFRSLALVVLATLLASSVYADGTVTTPANVAPASWKIASVAMSTGSGNDTAGVAIIVYYFDGSGNLLPNQTQTISLTSAEITSFLTTIESPVAGESGSVVKKYRQRMTSWLVANGKITNVTPE